MYDNRIDIQNNLCGMRSGPEPIDLREIILKSGVQLKKFIASFQVWDTLHWTEIGIKRLLQVVSQQELVGA